ncbi:hypothetical protein [Thiohalorhabdus sp.]|uniref:hypothetical protein n=1 Tax=Thiohalorhabdus sp. TaxID=3094134 RepID=UPI002FC337BD
MDVKITERTAERAALALRNQEREKVEAARQVSAMKPGGPGDLIQSPAMVADTLRQEAMRDANAAQEIEAALGWEEYIEQE